MRTVTAVAGHSRSGARLPTVPVRVAFDAQIFLHQEYGGISRYICGLARALAARSDVKVRVVTPAYVNRHLRALPSEISAGHWMPRLPRTGRLLRGYVRLLSPRLIERFAPTVLHHTYYLDSAYVPRGSGRVVTVHDMIHERFSSMFPANDRTTAMKRRAVKQADRVICVSEATRRDLLRFFEVDERNVFVVRHGFDTLTYRAGTTDIAGFDGGRRYILYVGARHGYKNFKRLLAAYSSSSWLRKNLRILCFGGGPFGAPDYAALKEVGLSIPDDVSQTGGDDDALAAAYQGAAGLVYPSLYEGFGLPLLEAMSLDCPVICSNGGALPEIGGNAVEQFDPLDIESMRCAIERALQSPTHRSTLVARGRARCAAFSWRRCADETLSVYGSIC